MKDECNIIYDKNGTEVKRIYKIYVGNMSEDDSISFLEYFKYLKYWKNMSFTEYKKYKKMINRKEKLNKISNIKSEN